MIKTLIPAENLYKSKGKDNYAIKTFDYTKIEDRLRTVIWSNYSNPTVWFTGSTGA